MMIGYVLTDTDILIVTNLVRGVNLAVAIGLMPSRKKFTVCTVRNLHILLILLFFLEARTLQGHLIVPVRVLNV